MPASTSLSSAPSSAALSLAGDRRQQREGELPADDRGDLRHLARLVEAVEPRHQRILERRRHRRAVLARRFHHAPGQLLDEQRHAIGLGDDRRDRFRLQAVRGRDVGDQPACTRRGSGDSSVSRVACGRVSQGGAKSGRAVTTASSCARAMLSVSRVIISSMVGSIQCASSSTMRTGSLSPTRATIRRRAARWSPPCVAPE